MLLYWSYLISRKGELSVKLYDNETRRSSFLQQNRMNHIQLNTNPPRSSRTQNIKMPSLPKKQILIQEAFSRIRNKKFTNDGNLEMKSS